MDSQSDKLVPVRFTKCDAVSRTGGLCRYGAQTTVSGDLILTCLAILGQVNEISLNFEDFQPGNLEQLVVRIGISDQLSDLQPVADIRSNKCEQFSLFEDIK